MKTRLMFVALFAVPAMLMASCSSNSLAAAPGSPFKGDIKTVETATFDLPTHMIVNGSGSGNATHLGSYIVMYHAEVTLNADGSGSSTGDTIHFMAANGDTLDAVGSGSGGGVNKVTQVYTVTGGTGRFAGAKGNFTVERAVDPPTGASSGTFDGTIVLAKGK